MKRVLLIIRLQLSHKDTQVDLLPFLFLFILAGCTPMSPSSPVKNSHDRPLSPFEELPSSPLISVQDALSLYHLKQADFLDARSFVVRYLAGHIPKAQHTPWFDFTSHKKSGRLLELDQLRSRIQTLGLTRTKPIIVYGSWHKGWGEEARIWWMLEYLGNPKVFILKGGWSAWRKKEGPRNLGSESKPPVSQWHPQTQTSTRILFEEIIHHFERSNTEEDPHLQWIDVRRKEEFQGKTPYGSKYGGHLPNAYHLHWASFFDSQGNLYDEAHIRSFFLQKGIRLDHPIAVYCTGGVRSAWIYMILRLIKVPQIFNYDGSWWEWSNRLPLQSHQSLLQKWTRFSNPSTVIKSPSSL